jgi:isopentenyl diphosphate isomerase/L-lactate dehydrogenase-like FMN-dependent dehydrogenase
MNDMASMRKIRGLPVALCGVLADDGAGAAVATAVGVDFLRGGNRIV